MPKLKPFRDLSRSHQNRRIRALRLEYGGMPLDSSEDPRPEELASGSCSVHTNTGEQNFNRHVTQNQESGTNLDSNGMDTNEETGCGTKNELSDDDDDELNESTDTDTEQNSASCSELSDNSKQLKIMEWALQYNIKQNALTALLKIFHNFGHTELPRDARTLLSTPRNTVIVASESGSYFHYGLENALIDQFKTVKTSEIPDTIFIDLGIDGLPLAKSSKSQLWPILGKIFDSNFSEPFMVGAFHGYKKPSSANKFLEQFINEYKVLHNEGFLYSNQRYTVTIRAVICDTPARTFVTCTKAHNGFFGCGCCVQEGEYRDHRMLFLEEDSPLRTDQSFTNRDNEEHHTGNSPFEEISLGMVTQFPLDVLHLVYLGVVKKLIGLWMKGYHTARLSAAKTRELSALLISIAHWIPCEFPRKPRALDEVDRWKATEFRLFLLYVGAVLLPKFLPKPNLVHFYTLHCAIRILSDPKDCLPNNSYAKELLLYFVQTFKLLYGEQNIIYNVHNLIHLGDHVKKYGHLESFSAFPYENYMQYLKKLVRKADRPLAQLHKRIVERSGVASQITKNREPGFPVLTFPSKKQLPLRCSDPHDFVQFRNFKLSCKTDADNCCYLANGSVILIQHIGYKNQQPVILGKKFTDSSPLPDYPCNSQDLSIHLGYTCSELELFPVNQIACKAVRFPFDNGYCIMPLLHSTV